MYGISYFKRAIRDKAEVLNESLSPSEEYVNYDNGRLAIIKKYAKYEGGRISYSNGNIRIQEDLIDECKSELTKYDDDNEFVINKQESDYKQAEVILKDVVSIATLPIDWNDIPDDIDQTLMDALLPIIIKKD